jgi:hypothetical protein
MHKQGVITMSNLVIKEDNFTDEAKKGILKLRQSGVNITEFIISAIEITNVEKYLEKTLIICNN